MYDVSRLLTAIFARDTNAKLFKNTEINNALKQLHKNPEAAELVGLERENDALVLHSANKLFKNTVYLSKGLESSADTDDITLLVMTSQIVAKDRMDSFRDSLLSLNLHSLNGNGYIAELGDVTVETENEQVLVKTQLHEHKLVAFDHAMRMAGFGLTWVHGYSHSSDDDHTYFACLYKRATQALELQYELFKSASVARLTRFVSHYSTLNYHVDLMQTLRSASQGHVVHVIVMRRLQTPKYVLFNVATDYALYQQDRVINSMDGYEVTVQSIEEVAGSKLVTYSMHKQLKQSQQLRTRTFDSLTAEQLQDLNEQQISDGYSLLYVDTYREKQGGDEQLFAVVYQPNSDTDTVTSVIIDNENLEMELRRMSDTGFRPSILVSHYSQENLQWLVQWQK